MQMGSHRSLSQTALYEMGGGDISQHPSAGLLQLTVWVFHCLSVSPALGVLSEL